MGDKTGISWTDATWNPLAGCSRVSEGCRRCYAELEAHRLGERLGQTKYQGLTKLVGGEPRWTGDVRLWEPALDQPLRWKRPRRIFVNSMSDLFHEAVPDEWIDQILGIMALATQHTFQVLTKRPRRMLDWWLARKPAVWSDPKADEPDLSNVCWGVSVEDQATADARIPLLLKTPAAVRWVSYEPALGEVHFEPWLPYTDALAKLAGYRMARGAIAWGHLSPLSWIVVGGESGPGARPFDLGWARSTVAQCRAAGVPVFVKQLGAAPYQRQIGSEWAGDLGRQFIRLKDRKGGDLAEWAEDLRVREFPR